MWRSLPNFAPPRANITWASIHIVQVNTLNRSNLPESFLSGMYIKFIKGVNCKGETGIDSL